MFYSSTITRANPTWPEECHSTVNFITECISRWLLCTDFLVYYHNTFERSCQDLRPQRDQISGGFQVLSCSIGKDDTGVQTKGTKEIFTKHWESQVLSGCRENQVSLEWVNKWWVSLIEEQWTVNSSIQSITESFWLIIIQVYYVFRLLACNDHASSQYFCNQPMHCFVTIACNQTSIRQSITFQFVLTICLVC